MKHILSPGQVWHGQPIRALRRGNRRPVALSDTLSLLQDSAPTTVVVLENDFDPEGGALNVISATALFGTTQIELDNTITYTPPVGFTGSDTITYVISDVEGQTHSSTVAIEVAAPTLSVRVEQDNTLSVDAELGQIDITVTQPAEHAGTFQRNLSDLGSGPVNLNSPIVAGDVTLGQTLSAVSGLWIYDTVTSNPSETWRWQRNGVDIAGATSQTYTVVSDDVGQTISAVQTLGDTFGIRDASGLAGSGSFNPATDTQLLGWWDASDLATLTLSGNSVQSWADKSGNSPLTQGFPPQQPASGVRTLNGLNTLDFNGGSLLQGLRTLPASGDVAFHMVVAIDSVASPFTAILAVDAANDFQIDANDAPNFNGRLNATGIGPSVNLTGGPFSGAMVVSAVFDQTGTAQAEVFISDISRGIMAYTAPIDAASTLLLMTNRSQNTWVDGAVAEVIVTGDITNRTAYQSYLSSKWGVS